MNLIYLDKALDSNLYNICYNPLFTVNLSRAIITKKRHMLLSSLDTPMVLGLIA